MGRRRARDGGPAHEPRFDQRRWRPAADLRQQGHSLVGCLAAVRLDRGAQPRAARGRGRQAQAGRWPPTGGDQHGPDGGRPHRLQRQLLGRAVDHAHPIRPRAQRDLRHAEGAPSDLGRRKALSQGAAGQRRPDRKDPHGRVDAGHPRPPGARVRYERELVWGPAQVGQAQLWPSRLGRAAQRNRRLAARPPHRPLLDHERVCLGLSHAPADPRRLPDPLAPDRRGDRRERLHALAGPRHARGDRPSTE